MVNKLRFAKRFLLLLTPIVTGSALAQIVVGIAASPSMAATVASSEAIVEIDNFTHNPQDIRILTNTNTFTFASSGSVTAQADANAIAKFDPNDPPQLISNFSSSKTSGEGSSYSGLAQSQAGVIAYDFLVGDGKPFSFNFGAFLDLNTSIDNPQSESASAAGGLAFNLYDSTDSNNLKLLDSFTISGNLTTPGDGNYLDSQNSNNITLSSDLKNTSFGGTQEAASDLVQGQFSRYFAHPTYLTLIEVKANQASVQVPEPSNTLALFFFGSIGVGLRVRSKLTRSAKLT